MEEKERQQPNQHRPAKQQKQKIKERGNNALDDNSGFKNAVQVDCSLCIQLTITKEEWKESEAIATGATFTKALGIKQVSNGRGPTQVTAFMTIVSTLWLNTIKFDREVWNYLKKQTVYIHLDRFLRNDVVSLGIIVDIHPDLVRKDDLEAELKTKLAQQPTPNTN
eukprot:11578038-Ditylum_brightwellii.AAC.1